MARTVLASELATRVRLATDCVNDTHISDAELYLWLTSAVAETWEKMQENGLGGEGVKTTYFASTTAGSYPIATVDNGPTPPGTGTVGIADFWKVSTLYVADGSGYYRPLTRTNPVEHYGQRVPVAGVNLKLCYIPCAPTFVDGTESFDGINGWEEHTVQLASVSVKNKKEDSPGPFQARVRTLEERMATHNNRNMDEPPRVVRRAKSQRWAQAIAPYIGGVATWDIRGGAIELYAPSAGLYY